MYSRRRFFFYAGTASIAAQSRAAHPRLLFDAAAIEQLRKRVRGPLWQKQWSRFVASVDTRLSRKVDLPPRGANWWHWYVCPVHGVRLTTGRRRGPWTWEHVCPVDQQRIPSDPSRPDLDLDGCAISSTHDGYAAEVRDAGIVYQVTGDDRYAAHAREILNAYAARYLDYPLHNTKGQSAIGGGRITSQTLDESVWLIPVAQGADLVWPTIPAGDRTRLADKLLLPAARDVILAHRMGIHNIQCWKNSAVGLTGFLLDDKTLIEAAIDDPDRGYRAQMAKGVQEDGVWFEGAWGYHFYTLRALWPLAEAARNSGIDLYGDPLRKMFEAPLNLAMPNLVLPAFNDSAETPVRNELYELACARYRTPLFLNALPEQDTQMGMFFRDRANAATSFTPASRDWPVSGYAILRTPKRNTWLCLKHGPHGGGHGHPDKNNFILYSQDRVLYGDPGTRPYGSPLHAGWDRATLAHNTLVVDETNQAQAKGECLAFGTEGGILYATTQAGAIYPGVDFVRTAIVLHDDLIVFIDRITADRDRTFDLAIHHNGSWRDLPAGEAFMPPDKDGYRYLQSATRRRITEPLTLSLDIAPGWSASIVLASNEPTDVITAYGPGKSTAEQVPAAVFRRTGRNAMYVWAAVLDALPVQLSNEEGRVKVASAGRSWHLSVVDNRLITLPD